jgi:hypothetical protein
VKLTILAPRWCVGAFTDPKTKKTVMPTDRSGMGISFLCPKHLDHRVAVFFANPIDGGPAVEGREFLMRRTGTTFEALTLGPSIDASKHTHGHDVKTSCWRGVIQNGEVR